MHATFGGIHMDFSNPYFSIILVAVVGLFVLDTVAKLLNLKALRPELPNEFSDVYEQDEYRRSQEYTRETARFDLIQSVFSLIVFLAFWLLGGFGWVDDLVRTWTDNPLIQGIYYVCVLFAASIVISLPWEFFDTFVIEEKYGFNKSTKGTFFVDQIKSLALGAALGLPLLALVFYLFERFDMAWLWGWIAVSGFSLAMAYLAPKFILPLFNKFTPLEDGELKSAIHTMAKNCDFPVCELSVMDGSKRSSKSNAFFTGFGKNKRIALFDTLIEKHSVAELVGVLAHEIGHFKKKHIVQTMVIGILQTGVLFFLINVFLKNEQLFAAFGVKQTSVYLSFILFSLLFKPVSKVLSVLMAIFSRKNEFEADAYAAEVTGDANSLVTALKKLSRDNLANLTPHPFYVFMYYSHPPLPERVDALKKLA
ncbi:MAG: STE24 endopeptidase [Verrucomicrobiales bacterium]|jgi:STE24 endopeptidase